MHKLRRKFNSRRRLNSASSSTAGSVSDLDDRVIMMCEDVPNERSSLDSGRGSRSLRARSSRGSQGEELDWAPPGRDRRSYRQACYGGDDAWREIFARRVEQVYGRLK